MKKISKARLVFYNGKSNAGGAERMVWFLDNYLQTRGLTTEIIDEAFLLNTWIGRLYRNLFKYHHFLKRKAAYMGRFTSVYLWLTKRPGRIVISNGEATPFYPSDVVYNHGCYHTMEQDYGRIDDRLGRVSRLQQRGCAIANLIVTVSVKSKVDLIAEYKILPSKIQIVANRIDTDYFLPIAQTNSVNTTVLYVGRLEEGKGLAVVLKLAELVDNADDWELLIASNNESNVCLFADFRKTSVLTGLTLQNINEKAYAMADVVIYPSRSESFGMVTIEALAAGVPIVGTPVGVLKELADENFPGVNLFHDFNEHLLDELATVVSKFRAEVDRFELHEKVKQRFGIASYHEQLDEVLNRYFIFPDKFNGATRYLH